MIRTFVFLVPCIAYVADIGELSCFGNRHTQILSFLIAAAVLFLIQITRPGGSPFAPAGGGTNMTPVFTLVSLALNFILSGSIVLRLLFFRQRITKDLGSAAGRQYISIAAMLIESTMLYTVVWICATVPSLLGSPFQNVFNPGCIHVQVCSHPITFIDLYVDHL
jgi:hypothetical protein